MSILELKDVRYTYRTQYQQVQALKGISCSFEEGKLYAIMGKSGSGKTTLLSLMAGLDLPSEGEVLCHGVSTARMDLERYRREQAAVIYQSFRLFPLLTVAENVMFPMELRGVKPRAARARAAELIRRVSLPEAVLNRYPTMLSGGEQQRVAIARALVNNPSMIIADEPTGNLDPARSLEIMMLLEQINALGTTVMVVTHEKELVNRFTKRVVAINEGKIISDGMDGYYLNEEE